MRNEEHKSTNKNRKTREMGMEKIGVKSKAPKMFPTHNEIIIINDYNGT